MNYRIAIDSCGELTEEMKADRRIVSVPLTLEIKDCTFIDDESFDQADFIQRMAASSEPARSACPSPELYMQAYDCDAERIYGVTLSAELSGSYNSAVLARQLFMERHPDKQVYIFNSKSASVGETLIALKIMELEERGLSFEEVIEKVEAYIASQHTYFVLENLDNLRKNGRLGLVKGLLASALKIKPVMGSNEDGAITQLDQARGINKALVKLAECLSRDCPTALDRTLAISHVNNPRRAEIVKEGILSKVQVKDTIVLNTAGVSTLYANDGGIIVVI